MAFNGSGTFVRLYNWANDKAAAIKIRADRMDNEMNGFATGLSTCITKDGQTTISANLPMSTFKHTGVGDASARDQYASYGQVQDGKTNWIAAGGTANAITATYSPAIGTLVDGQLFFVRASAANTTTTPTFSPNGETARTIVKNGGAALAVGDIVGSGHELVLRYNLANTRYELLNPRNVDASIVTAASTLTSNAVVKGDGARGLSATSVYIDASNNVGIGSAPASGYGLDVIKGTGVSSGIRAKSGTHSADLMINDASGASITLSNADPLIFSQNGAEKMRLHTNGYLGVGKTPSYPVDVNGDIATSGQYRGKNACSFWVNFNGTGTVAIRDSFNVASITDNGVGDYTVNFTNTFSNANYSATAMCSGDGAAATYTYLQGTSSVATTSSMRFNTFGTSLRDPSWVCVIGFGGY